MTCSVYGCAETTEGHAFIRKGPIMARIIRACTASEDRSRKHSHNSIPYGWCVLLQRLAIFTIISGRLEDLASKKRYAEAGQVLLDYAEDEREAVIALVQGNQFSEARRIVS